MSLDIDEVIRNVVRDHGILLRKEDPLISLLAANDTLISEYFKNFSDRLNSIEKVPDPRGLDIQTLRKDLYEDFKRLLADERILRHKEQQSMLKQFKKMRITTSFIALFVGVFSSMTVFMLFMTAF